MYGKMSKLKAIVSCSGGLDSTTLLYHIVKDLERDVLAVSFDYGQNHVKEIEYAKHHANELNIEHRVINLKDFYKQINNSSALTTGSDNVPDADYSNDVQPITYVSNRNLFFSIIMSSIAEEVKASEIYLGIQRVDSFNGYWDTSETFVERLQALMNLNTSNQVKLVTPFVNMNKSDEIAIGNRLGLDYAKTMSCYKGINCGTCSTCRERILAFESIGLTDPINYKKLS